MQKISVITQPTVIRAILASVGRNTGPPQRSRSRTSAPREAQISLGI
jgi:hypothetical protein